VIGLLLLTDLALGGIVLALFAALLAKELVEWWLLRGWGK